MDVCAWSERAANRESCEAVLSELLAVLRVATASVASRTVCFLGLRSSVWIEHESALAVL